MTASNSSPLVDAVGEPTSGEGAATVWVKMHGYAWHMAPVQSPTRTMCGRSAGYVRLWDGGEQVPNQCRQCTREATR